MRFINIEDKKPPDAWCAEAEKHTKALQELSTYKERMDYIDQYSNVWGELKYWLQELSHDKCWYSETIDRYSHYQVEHFRPKKKVVRFKGIVEEGYWWLAFDWKNYRLSGDVGNKRKGNRFPLRKGSVIATGPSCDLQDELIYLLDPTDPSDPPLLTFNALGNATPAASEGTWEYERAKVTIEVLYLNFPRLVDGRVMAWKKCSETIDKAEELMKENSKSSSATKREKIRAIFNELKEMANEKTQFSATSRACLLNSGRLWARNLIN
jgi:uncharacterized protein (TIGR02646 family)